MKPRGSYDRSDYGWSSILRDAAHFLMDEGAGDRPLSLGEITRAVQQGSTLPGDFRRAAFQVEGHEDRERGAEILTTEALRSLKKAKLVVEEDAGFRWIGNGRTDFTAHGKKFPLVPRAERDQQQARALVEAQFIMAENQLPKRSFDPDSSQGKALIASLRTVGFDDDFPILVDNDGEIVSGYSRVAACEIVGIDWRDHTRTVRFKNTGPIGNMERTGKAVRANIGEGLSPATRRALAQKLRLEGDTVAEIAEALGVSTRTAYRDAPTGTDATVANVPAKGHPSDEELITLAMGQIEARPEMSNNQIAEEIRGEGYSFGRARGLKAARAARSRLTTKAPKPVPPPPEPERVERIVMRRIRQIVVGGVVVHEEVVHEELEEEWVDG